MIKEETNSYGTEVHRESQSYTELQYELSSLPPRHEGTKLHKVLICRNLAFVILGVLVSLWQVVKQLWHRVTQTRISFNGYQSPHFHQFKQQVCNLIIVQALVIQAHIKMHVAEGFPAEIHK